jgi:hypothetical protein
MSDCLRVCLALALAAMWAVGCFPESRSLVPRPKPGNEPRVRAAEMIASGQIRFTGGDGAPTGPVVIEGTDDEFAGIAAEYLYIESKHGRPRVDWIPVSQSFGCDSVMCVDTIEIEVTRTGEHLRYTFDISAFRPPEPERETVDVSVSSDGGGLRFSVSEPVLEITCMRYPDKMWVGRCTNDAGCGGSFSYGGHEFMSSYGPVGLTEGAYNCGVVAAGEASGAVEFCLNRSGEVGPCRRE